jgi:hypothetical protein
MVGAPRRAVLPAALAAVLLLAAASAFADPVAVIAAVKGRVEVTPTGTREPLRATFGRALEPGDKVTVGPAGSATLFFNDGNVIELGEKSALTVSGRVVRAGGAKAGLSGEVYASVSKFVTTGNRKTGLVASSGMRSGGDTSLALILSPRQSDVLTDAPAIAWRGVHGATRYRVTVTSAAAGELWSQETDEIPDPTDERRLAWPPDAPRLEPGVDCLLQIEALDDVKSLRTESTTLRLASSGTIESVHTNLEHIASSAGGRDNPAALWLSGSYLSGLNLNGEALERFLALARLNPGSSAAHEALGNVYAKVGLMDLAAAEYQQALGLAREAD